MKRQKKDIRWETLHIDQLLGLRWMSILVHSEEKKSERTYQAKRSRNKRLTGDNLYAQVKRKLS